MANSMVLNKQTDQQHHRQHHYHNNSIIITPPSLSLSFLASHTDAVIPQYSSMMKGSTASCIEREELCRRRKSYLSVNHVKSIFNKIMICVGSVFFQHQFLHKFIAIVSSIHLTSTFNMHQMTFYSTTHRADTLISHMSEML